MPSSATFQSRINKGEKNVNLKHRKNREKLHREHLIGCQGVKLFLLKDVTITTVTTATFTTVTI